MQSKIWPTAKAALRQQGDMSNPEKALLVAAINEVLDAHTTRMFVFYDRLPMAVLPLLVLIAAASLAVAAYNASLSGHRYRWRMTTFAVILSALMYIILDFDMMLRGFIQVNHESLASLIQEMETAVEP